MYSTGTSFCFALNTMVIKNCQLRSCCQGHEIKPRVLVCAELGVCLGFCLYPSFCSNPRLCFLCKGKKKKIPFSTLVAPSRGGSGPWAVSKDVFGCHD